MNLNEQGILFGALVAAVVVAATLIPFARARKRRTKERQLFDAEQAQFFTLSADMLAVSKDGYFRRLNSAFEKTLGYTLEELTSRPFIEFVHPDDRARTKVRIDEERSIAEVSVFENRYLCKDGSYKLLSWKSARVGGSSYSVARDVTEIRRAEAEISKAKLMLDAIVENMPSLLFIKDAEDLRYVRYNRAGAAALGYEPEDFLGKTAHDFFDKEIADAFAIADRKVLAEDVPVDFPEEKINSRHGGIRIMHTKKVGIKTPDGHHYLLGISDDVTESKKIESELISARAVAEQANRAKSDFIANMSHEIRTPLNGIIGITDLLADSSLSPEQRDLFRVLQESGTALLALVNDILDFSKIEAGKMSLEQLPFDPLATLESQLSVLMARAKEKNLEVKVIADRELPKSLLGDPSRIGQIILNLFSNSIKFTNEGSITVRIRQTESSDHHSILEYSVEDTGIGVSEEQKKILFNPFTQADGSMARKYGGTGLGLSICRQLAILMEGQIELESEVGKGSKFFVRLRLRRGVERIPDSVSLLETSKSIAVAKESPRKILVAEDNSTNQIVIRGMLKKLGYSFRIVANGREAVDATLNEKFDLILMDCQMPEMDGYAATRMIRQHEAARGLRTPIVAFTANILSEDRLRCTEAGMDDFVSKPVKIALLEEALRNGIASSV